MRIYIKKLEGRSVTRPMTRVGLLILRQNKPVAVCVVEHRFDNAIRPIGWRLAEFYAFGLHILVRLLDIVRLKDADANLATFDQFGQHFDVIFVQWAAWFQGI